MIFASSFLIISIDGFDITTNLTAVASALSNIGPGLEVVGPAGNFGGFSYLSKLILIIDMLAVKIRDISYPIVVLSQELGGNNTIIFSAISWTDCSSKPIG